MKQSKYRKIFGVLLIIYGVIAFVTPGIPGVWFIFIGLEFFGIKLLLGEKIKEWWHNQKTRLTGRASLKSPKEPAV